jgi:predicted metal-dependent hydrolase
MQVLVVGNTEIPYEVRYSPRARRRRIVVTPGRVEVVAPAGMAEAEVAAYIRARRRWVFDAVEALREREGERARPGRFITGAKVLYRGRRVGLRVLVGSEGDDVRVEYRGGFVVTVPPGLVGSERDARIEAVLEGWFRERVREDAERIVRRYAPRLGVTPAGVRIKEQKHLWGSCGRDGVIHLNWQLVFAPRAVLEYAVVHELCHLLERSHGAGFWRVVQEVMPDYEPRKGWLERNGWGCRWR